MVDLLLPLNQLGHLMARNAGSVRVSSGRNTKSQDKEPIEGHAALQRCEAKSPSLDKEEVTRQRGSHDTVSYKIRIRFTHLARTRPIAGNPGMGAPTCTGLVANSD